MSEEPGDDWGGIEFSDQNWRVGEKGGVSRNTEKTPQGGST